MMSCMGATPSNTCQNRQRQLLLALSVRHSQLYESVLGLRGKGMTKEDWEEVKGAGGIRLYHGVPGKKSGHAV